jgi:hypothetical protein
VALVVKMPAGVLVRGRVAAADMAAAHAKAKVDPPAACREALLAAFGARAYLTNLTEVCARIHWWFSSGRYPDVFFNQFLVEIQTADC